MQIDKIVAMRGSESQTYYERKPLWWLLPDDMVVPPIDVPEQGFPQIVQYRPEKTIPFTVELQNYIFNLNRSDNEQRDRQAFQGYRDTWNTNGKVREHYNAITGEGNPNDLPALQVNIGAGANVVSGIPEVSDGSALYGIKSGVPVLRLETMHPDNLLSGISNKTHPHLIHHLVIIRPNIFDGHNLRNPFIQMGGKSIPPYRPSFTALISPIPLYIEMYKVRKVTEIPNPYNPEWNWST